MALHSLPDQTLTASPTALSAGVSIRATWVQVQTNVSTGVARIGDHLISATRGGIIGIDGYQFAPTQGNANAYDLSDIYVLGTPGDTIAILYDTF